MKQMLSILIILVAVSSVLSNCNESNDEYLFVAFWNLENLFDTTDDPDKNDEDFLPSGAYEWTEERLEGKMYNLARVIRSMNNNNAPDILGVCELEHTYLLDSMNNHFLSDFNFRSIGPESPDARGIDNALMYKADKFELLSMSVDTVNLTAGYQTRLILQVSLLTKLNDTLHIFVNHFPSRRGGEEKSERSRIETAQTLRNSVNKILEDNPDAKILIMGDFNDEPTNNSILNTLEAVPFKCDSLPWANAEDLTSELFNTSYQQYEDGIGSYKYRDDWNMLDQIIISKELLIGESLKYECDSFEVYKPSFMVTQSGTFEGTPFPTYGGRRYLGGYSDHFAVTAKFIYLR